MRQFLLENFKSCCFYPIIQTDCDMIRVITEYTFSPDMPHEDEYQFICEDCFPENE